MMTEDKKIEEITEYVYKNYKLIKIKPLIVTKFNNCFHILVHKDSSPLILGKKLFQ